MMIDSTDLEPVAVALGRQFPELHPVTGIRLLGAGFSSIVVEIAGAVVMRIAKTREAAAGHAREAQLLPTLQSRLPVPIPQPQWYCATSQDFPFGVIGYPKVPGRPLDPGSIAHGALPGLVRDLATLLHALHAVPLATVEGLGLPAARDHTRWLAALAPEVLPVLRHELTPDEYRRLIQWWDAFIADPQLHAYPVCLCHGDLWYENLLVAVEPLALSGVVDFEHAGLGDPAQDFATLLYLGEPVVAGVLAAYEQLGGQADRHLRYRMQCLWEARDFGGLQYAIRYNDVAELRDAICKIRQGPILKAAGR